MFKISTLSFMIHHLLHEIPDKNCFLQFPGVDTIQKNLNNVINNAAESSSLHQYKESADSHNSRREFSVRNQKT